MEWILIKAQYDFFSHHIIESVGYILSKRHLMSITGISKCFTVLENGEENNKGVLRERLLTFPGECAED